MNRNRINELTNLLSSFNLSTEKCLLVTGPTGSGKTHTTLQVLNDLGLEFSIETFDNCTEYDQFMTSFCKYKPLTLITSLEIPSNSLSKRIVVVKDPPFCITHRPSADQFVTQTCKYIKHALIIFIITQTTHSNIVMSAFTRIPHNLIEFKPIAQTYISKALRASNSLCDKSFVEGSNGDLRFAKNSLDFYTKNTSLKIVNSSRSKRRKVDRGQEQTQYSSSSLQKDVQLDIFHALGKIFYAKRIDEPVKNLLPPHLFPMQRSPPKDDVFGVIDQVSMAIPDSRNLLLHLSANIPHFAGHNIAYMERSLTFLSDADLLYSFTNYVGIDYPLVVSTLGTFFSNDNTIRHEKFFHFRQLEYLSQVYKSPQMENVHLEHIRYNPTWTFSQYLNDYYPLQRYLIDTKRIFGSTDNNDLANAEWWMEEDDVED